MNLAAVYSVSQCSISLSVKQEMDANSYARAELKNTHRAEFSAGGVKFNGCFEATIMDAFMPELAVVTV